MLQKLSGQKQVDFAVFLRPDVMYLNELPVFLFNHFPAVSHPTLLTTCT
jgi:hypothetical protein